MYKYLSALIVYFVCTLLMLFVYYNRFLIGNYIRIGLIFAIGSIGALIVLKLKKM